MSYRACIFDLDGTLCDSVESIAWSGNRMLSDLGLRQATLEEYKAFVGDGVDVLMRRLLRFGGDEECARFEKAKKLSRLKEETGENFTYEPIADVTLDN